MDSLSFDIHTSYSEASTHSPTEMHFQPSEDINRSGDDDSSDTVVAHKQQQRHWSSVYPLRRATFPYVCYDLKGGIPMQRYPPILAHRYHLEHYNHTDNLIQYSSRLERANSSHSSYHRFDESNIELEDGASNLGTIVCNKCGLYERTHLPPRPSSAHSDTGVGNLSHHALIYTPGSAPPTSFNSPVQHKFPSSGADTADGVIRLSDRLSDMEALTGTTRIKHGFVLCIGINKYKSNINRPLRGAVADAREIAGYFRDQLKVPEEHITILEDDSATRDGILQGFQRLANDPRIRYGDPIVIFYAGHGSEGAAPPEWDAGGPDANIQFIVPYDAYCDLGGETVAPIPDRTLGALLDAIAQAKGNNIIVLTDSCYSASGTRSLNGSSDSVRCTPLPSNFQLQGSLDADLRHLPLTDVKLRSAGSHVHISACASSELACESGGRGVFTVALLDLLRNSQIDKLRYSDIVMQMEIDPRYGQAPHCEGFNRDAFLFTTTSPPRIEHFIPAYTRKSKDGPFAYILNGGAAHGVVVGDEFAIHSDVDCPEPVGTLTAEEVGSFYSVMRPPSTDVQIACNSIAVRINKGDHEHRQNATADFPAITGHVQVEIYELHQSRFKFSGSPTAEILPATAVPYEDDTFSLQPGSLYGLKLTNNSSYDLYPTVQYFDDCSDLKPNTWYRPACSRSRLDVPLRKGGGSLTIGYGSGGSPPLVIPSSTKGGLLYLKILLSTRPLDTLYDDKSFRSARFLPNHLKGPWATITRSITYRPSQMQSAPPSSQTPREVLVSKLAKSPINHCVLCLLGPIQGSTTCVSLSDFNPPPIYDPFGWWNVIGKYFRLLHGIS